VLSANAIGNRIVKESILCADRHVSYKGFAKDSNLSLVVLRADLKQQVKHGIYHIQNVNSLHNRIKKWIDSTFWGVSTKYIQNYLNWDRIQEAYKKSICVKQDMANGSTEDIFSLKRYRLINDRYQTLITTQIYTTASSFDSSLILNFVESFIKIRLNISSEFKVLASKTCVAMTSSNKDFEKATLAGEIRLSKPCLLKVMECLQELP